MFLPRYIAIDNSRSVVNLFRKIKKNKEKLEDNYDYFSAIQPLKHLVLDILMGISEMEIVSNNNLDNFKKIVLGLYEALHLDNETESFLRSDIYIDMLDNLSKMDIDNRGIFDVSSKYSLNIYSSSSKMYDYSSREDLLPLTEFNEEFMSNVLNQFSINRDTSVIKIHYGSSRLFSQAFKNVNDKFVLYGVENNEDLYYKNKPYFDKTAFGLGRNSKISNNVFDIGYVEPRLTDFIKGGAISNRSDRTQIDQLSNYVREDGLMMIKIPAIRLYRDVVLQLSKMLKDVEIYYPEEEQINTNSEFEDLNGLRLYDIITEFNNNYILIVGKKKITNEVDNKTFSKLSNVKKNWVDNKRSKYIIKDSDYNKKRYEVPNFALEVENFRGFNIDKEDLEDLVINSDVLTKQIEKMSNSDNEVEIEPLLPFTLGQIGLVLTSGRLDGMIHRGGIDYHVIKGRVVRDTIVKEETAINGREQEVSIHTNKVEISLFDNEGNFKKLT